MRLDLGFREVAVKPYLPGPRLVKGLLFGLLLFLVAGVPFLLGALGIAFVGEELSIGPRLLGRSLFGALRIAGYTFESNDVLSATFVKKEIV